MGKKWLVTFSPSKTESMVISLRPHAEKRHPRLVFYNTPIAHVRCHKHIGLWISDNLNLNKHIDSLVDKCSKLTGILKFFKFKLNRKALEKMFFAYIRPVMEYADVVWTGASNRALSKLDHIVVEAMRTVTGTPARSSTSNLYKDTDWLPLSTRRKIHVLKMVFKISNNLCPNYLNNILPSVLTEYPLRIANLRHNIDSRPVLGNFPLAQTRTKLQDNMFSALGIRLWNALPNKLKHLSSLKHFTKEISKINCIPKQSKQTGKLFSHGQRLNNITHACLRMGCSKLNTHLAANLHVLDDESCQCGYPHENPYHFFLQCPLYNNIRPILNDAVVRQGNPDITLDILLYGSNNLNFEQNLSIFKAVHEFISLSKRF